MPNKQPRAQLDRHINRSVHLIRGCGIAVQILVVHIAFRSRKAERFAVCGKIEHAVILRGRHTERGKHTVRHIGFAAETRRHGALVERQDGVVYRCQRHRMRRCRQKRQQQRGTQHTADDFFDTHSLLSAIRTNILYQSTAGLSPFLPKNTLRCENRVL